MNTQALNNIHVITNSYVDQFRQEKEQSGRDLGIEFYDESSDSVRNNQDNDFNDNKITNLESIKIIRVCCSVNELANKKYVDNSKGEGTIVRFNQTLQNYLKVSFGKTH